MPYCSNCGKEVEAGAKFCPNCGGSLGRGPGSVAVQAPARPRASKPPLTTPLTWLALLVGVVFVFFGIVSVFLTYTSVAVLLVTLFAFFAVGVLSLASAYGLNRGRRWLFGQGRVDAIVSLLVGVLFIVSVPGLLTILGALGIVLGVSLLYYLRRPEAKRYLVG